MKAAIKHWYCVFRAEGVDHFRSLLLALLKVAAGDRR